MKRKSRNIRFKKSSNPRKNLDKIKANLGKLKSKKKKHEIEG